MFKEFQGSRTQCQLSNNLAHPSLEPSLARLTTPKPSRRTRTHRYKYQRYGHFFWDYATKTLVMDGHIIKDHDGSEMKFMKLKGKIEEDA